MQLFSQAKIIASVHGAGLTNLLFAAKGIKIFEIFPQYYHDNGPQLLALMRECRYSYMIGRTEDTSMHPQQEHVFIDTDELKLALDKIINA